MIDDGTIARKGQWEDLKDSLEKVEVEINEKEHIIKRRASGGTSKFSSNKVSTNYGALEKQSQHSFSQANHQ